MNMNFNYNNYKTMSDKNTIKEIRYTIKEISALKKELYSLIKAYSSISPKLSRDINKLLLYIIGACVNSEHQVDLVLKIDDKFLLEFEYFILYLTLTNYDKDVINLSELLKKLNNN